MLVVAVAVTIAGSASSSGSGNDSSGGGSSSGGDSNSGSNRDSSSSNKDRVEVVAYTCSRTSNSSYNSSTGSNSRHLVL